MSKKAPDGHSGATAFESFYGNLYGERWPAMRAALLSPVSHVAWNEGLVKTYYLDAGSVQAALSLPLPPDGRVLDMCAAPGGKSLIIASRLSGESTLVSNEYSRDRKNRLISVLDQHLPPETRSRVTVTGRDASRWSRYEQSAYDSILLDAPCSSERHVLSAPQYLAEWSGARIRNLAQRQWSLLSGAWLVLKPGGYLMYSTCALAPAENDGIIERLTKKYDDVEIIPLCMENHGVSVGGVLAGGAPAESRPDADTQPHIKDQGLVSAEPTRFGYHVLPDISNGSGPLYFALTRKKTD